MAVKFKLIDIWLHKGKNRTTILQKINLQIQAEKIYTIIGPSGSGKTSLLKLFNRLEDPTRGEILYNNRPIREFNIQELRRQVGMVFQLPALFPGTVSQNILYGPSLQGKNFMEEDNALELLQQVGLKKELWSRNVEYLSIGEQQRVAIARTLANKPEVILLDEPTSALDPGAVHTVEKLITDLQKQLNLTVIWITHNMSQAQRVGNRTVLLVDGQVIEENDTSTLFRKPAQQITRQYIEGGVVS